MVQATTLPSGLRVVTEEMASVRSVAVGCWVDAGTRDELPTEAGSAHFLEHLLFKGSEAMPARAISEAFDAVGGRSNAFTNKEHTCFWAQLRHSDLALGVEVLAEMLQRPAFRPHEIEAERHVVLEEINMTEDDPADVSHEQFAAALWEGHDLARPVLGTRRSILAMRRQDVAAYWRRRYHAAAVVVAAAGSLDHLELVRLVDKRFGGWEAAPSPRKLTEPDIRARVRVKRRDTEQSHLTVGGPGLVRADERRFAAGLLNHVLGGGMSSRLFQRIREEQGLAYSIYSFLEPFSDSGAFGVYAGTTPIQTTQVLEMIWDEIRSLAEEGVAADELARAKSNAHGSLALSSEEPNSRMIRLGRREIAGLEHLSFDEILERYDRVSRADVNELSEALVAGPRVIGAVGPFDASDLEPLGA